MTPLFLSWLGNLKSLISWEFFWSYPTKNLKIQKLSFTFLETIPAWQKPSRFINSYLRCRWFKNSEIWLAESLLDLTKLSAFKTLTKLKAFKSTFILLQSISECKKSGRWTKFFLRYSSFKNLKTWLAVSISCLSWIYIYMPKIKLIHQILLEIYLTQEFCNFILTGWDQLLDSELIATNKKGKTNEWLMRTILNWQTNKQTDSQNLKTLENCSSVNMSLLEYPRLFL